MYLDDLLKAFSGRKRRATSASISAARPSSAAANSLAIFSGICAGEVPAVAIVATVRPEANTTYDNGMAVPRSA
jgi:hypothetical protein